MDNSVYLALMGITQWQGRGVVEITVGAIWSLYTSEGLLKGVMVEGAGISRSEAEKNQVNELVIAISASISLKAQLKEPEGAPEFILAFQPDLSQKQAFSTHKAYYEFPFQIGDMQHNPALKRELWLIIKGFKA